MHDNGFVHTARVIKDLLEEMGIETMVWPPYSPALNLIETYGHYAAGDIS